MRVAAGPYAFTSRGGMTVHVDQPLSQCQVDVLCATLAAGGFTPSDVYAVDLDGEQPPIIHHTGNTDPWELRA